MSEDEKFKLIEGIYAEMIRDDQQDESNENDNINKRMSYRFGKRGMSYRFGKRGAMPYRFGKRMSYRFGK
jgi:hypothetical protein